MVGRFIALDRNVALVGGCQGNHESGKGFLILGKGKFYASHREIARNDVVFFPSGIRSSRGIDQVGLRERGYGFLIRLKLFLLFTGEQKGESRQCRHGEP